MIFINPFEVPDGTEDEALAMWEKFRDWIRQQPGCIDTKLYRAIGPDARFRLVNVAEWETEEAFQASVNQPEFLELTKGAMEKFPHFPGLYEVILS